MVSLSAFVVTAVLVVVLAYFFQYKKNGKNGKKALPGPMGLPIVGDLLSIGRVPYLKFGEWVKNYGSIYMVDMMSFKMVVIHDQKLAREAYNNPILLGKPDLEIFTLFSGGRYGLLSTESSDWVEQRRFTLRHLRDFGFGKNSMEDLVMNEVNEFVDWLKSEEGTVISVNRKFTLAVVNSLWSIMGGQRFQLDDPKLTNLLDSMTKAFAESTESPIALFLPKLAKAFPKLSGWNKLMDCVTEFHTFIGDYLKEHRTEFNPNENPRDFTDAYLLEINKTTDPNSTFYKELGDQHLPAVLGDLFGAGSGTTSETLSWAILYLTTWPEYQTKLQEEIDRVVGKSRTVCLEDRKDMPLCLAIISETLRMSSLTPLGVFHSAMADTSVGDFHIPKGTMIAVNQHYIHMDPAVWKDPQNFRPERFLSPDGKTVLKNESLIPFSVGKRACVGESLARDEVFLFLTNVLQKFRVELDPKSPKPSLEPATTLFLNPHPYFVIMKDRTV